jgi:predicted permease
VLWVALTIALAVAVGFEAERRAGAAAATLARRLLMAMLYVLAPFAAFFNVAHLDVSADVRGGILAGLLALLLAGGVGWVLARRVLRLPPPSAGVVTLNGLMANTAYLGLPLVAAVLGVERLSEAAAYDALVQGPVFLLAGFAVAAATGTRVGETARERLRAFFVRNPPLLATLAALVAPSSLAPHGLLVAARLVVFAMLPLGFFAVGVTLASEADDGHTGFPPPLTPAVAVAALVRLVVAPLLLLALTLPFIDLPTPFLILAAMPAGLNTITLAHAYGLDLRLAAGAIAWSTAIAVAVALVLVAVL